MIAIVFVTLCILILFIYLFLKRNRQLKVLELKLPGMLKKAREDAIKKSHTGIRGKVTEEMVSLIPGFPYVSSDLKFLGAPIDYFLLQGMSELRDNGTGEITIVIADVKVNTASLTKVEKAIKEAVEAKRIRFETWSVKDGIFSIKQPNPKKVKKLKPTVDGSGG